uniref:Signal recognition particle 14 kDa protein n=1 Tax=Macaca fascicularis TaxID=9541 RepID=A0A7N9IC37_MACFA
MVLLESEQFLTELTRLFQKCRTSGSVYITLKKCKQREGSRAMLPGCPVSGSHRSLSAADRRLPLPSVTLYWAHSGLRAWKMMGIVAGAVPSAEPPRLLLVSSKEVNKFQMVSFGCSLCLPSQGKSQHDSEHWVRLILGFTALWR